MAVTERENEAEQHYKDHPDFPQSEVVKYSLVPEPNPDAFNAVAHGLVVDWPMVREAAEARDLGAITKQAFERTAAGATERLARHSDLRPRNIGHTGL